MARRITYSATASNTLRGIIRHHKRLLEPERGDKVVQSIRITLLKLSERPGLGKLLRNATQESGVETRAYLHHRTYWIIYECLPERLFILDIHHGARLPHSMLE